MRHKTTRMLLRMAWLVYRGKLHLDKIALTADRWYVSLYTQAYYERMFKVKPKDEA